MDVPPRLPTVLHVDLDAFFVSMELLRHPELRGLPVVVGGTGNRGVVTTCSYEARKFGVHSAMPVAQARRLCPQATYLDSDYAFYAPASKQFHAILRDFTPLTEPAGADEAYMDVRGCERLFGDGEAIAKAIRKRVRDEVGIAASVGVSANKLVSKVASDAAKPDGLLVVPVGEEAAFFAPRPLRDLPMVGPKSAEALAKLGVKTIGDLAKIPPAFLRQKWGVSGTELHNRSNGRFDAPVLAGRGEAKSVSREITFGHDEPDETRLRAVLRGEAERVAADLAANARSARTVHLKLRFPPFETLTRASTPPAPVSIADEIYREGVALFSEAWRLNGRRPVRLIGIGVSNLQERAHQLRLGESMEPEVLSDTVAALRDRFGEASVKRAAELGNPLRAEGPGTGVREEV